MIGATVGLRCIFTLYRPERKDSKVQSQSWKTGWIELLSWPELLNSMCHVTEAEIQIPAGAIILKLLPSTDTAYR